MNINRMLAIQAKLASPLITVEQAGQLSGYNFKLQDKGGQQ